MAAYVPFDDRPFRLRMGLRPLDLGDWLEPDEHRDAELALKARLVGERHDDVVAIADASGDDATRIDAACEELATAVGAGSSAHHPIVRAGLATQEDWAVMTPVDGQLVLSAACVCFPTRWVLRTKIGLPMADVHRHVAFYAEHLERPVDSFFDRLTVERPVWRLNWNLMDDPELFQPVHLGPPSGTDITAHNAGEHLWLRVERQTLRRMPRTQAIVFGIRVHQRPLAALAGEPGALEALRAAVGKLPPETVAYKDLGGFTDQLDRWIANALRTA